MSLEAQRVFLSNKVDQTNLGIPVALPNQPFKIPENATYGEFFIMGAKGFVAGGAGRGKVTNRYPGVIQFNVFVPQDKGMKSATVAMDKFVKAFQLRLGRDSEGSTYQFKVAETIGPMKVEGHEIHIVRIPFTRDSIETVEVSL